LRVNSADAEIPVRIGAIHGEQVVSKNKILFRPKGKIAQVLRRGLSVDQDAGDITVVIPLHRDLSTSRVDHAADFAEVVVCINGMIGKAVRYSAFTGYGTEGVVLPGYPAACIGERSQTFVVNIFPRI
jgi:hypothetical protein